MCGVEQNAEQSQSAQNESSSGHDDDDKRRACKNQADSLSYVSVL